MVLFHIVIAAAEYDHGGSTLIVPEDFSSGSNALCLFVPLDQLRVVDPADVLSVNTQEFKAGPSPRFRVTEV